jgi:CubicO group peptidase (beta-lactamase class C family)
MPIHVIGSFNQNKLYCAGSLTKLLTTFVCLSLLAEDYDLKIVVDDETFLTSVCQKNPKAQAFLKLFQSLIGGPFTIRDLCSYYSGLTYTFDLSETELKSVEAGHPFKHHHIPDEASFLDRCQQSITPLYQNRCKFHYSELGLLFLGYFIEQIYSLSMEELYSRYLIKKFTLKASQFSRKRPPGVFIQDLSPKYDYPSIAILDHGYFCYSNGYFTTLQDMKILLEKLLKEPVFHYMTDLSQARAASNRILNGLAVELRLVGDDIIYGYEGLSYSGCNIWAYSTQKQEGYITFSNDEEKIYDDLYSQFPYHDFDSAPAHTQAIYSHFLKNYRLSPSETATPEDFQGRYQRVKINDKELATVFHLGKDYLIIRNPDEIKYELVYFNQQYRIKGKDKVPGTCVSLYTAKSGNRYLLFDGTLYKRLGPEI